MIKSCSFFRVKWIGINKQGCTWEPLDHLIGENAETILKIYLAKKETRLATVEKRKHDALAGILVETGMAENKEKDNDDDKQPSSKPAVKVEANQARVNDSTWRHHFGKWFWDNTVTPAAKRAVCLLCQVLLQILTLVILIL